MYVYWRSDQKWLIPSLDDFVLFIGFDYVLRTLNVLYYLIYFVDMMSKCLVFRNLSYKVPST